MWLLRNENPFVFNLKMFGRFHRSRRHFDSNPLVPTCSNTSLMITDSVMLIYLSPGFDAVDTGLI